MKKLAIKGHETRGREVIEILEMLGGKNVHDYVCNVPGHAYIINKRGIIDFYIPHPNSSFAVFTLEEFLEKFPYKIGDNVIFRGNVAQISSLRWNGVDMVYIVEHNNELGAAVAFNLQPYKKENIKERDKKAVNHVFETEVISFDFAQKDKYELDLQGKFEVVLREGKYYVERIKSQYPKTYEECCKIMGAKSDRHYCYTKKDKYEDYPHEVKLLDSLDYLRQLLICRDAYWKLAGEQMGLGKPWEPQFENCSIPHYCIFINHTGEIYNDCFYGSRCLLAFPTVEMRDAFYENFKELIESCKELL